MAESFLWPYIKDLYWLGLIAMLVGLVWIGVILQRTRTRKEKLTDTLLPLGFGSIVDRFNDPDPERSTTKPVILIAVGFCFFIGWKMFVDYVEGYLEF